MRVIRSQEWQAQPWKNGGGTTHEIARHQDARGVVWRVSVADVSSDGPFSHFPGLDRHIALVEGRGLRLHFADAKTITVDQPYAPYPFPGESAVDCTLLAGPVRDWNLMTRRDSVLGRARAVSLPSGATLHVQAAEATLVFVGEGEVGAAGVSLARFDSALLPHGQHAVSAKTAVHLLLAEIERS